MSNSTPFSIFNFLKPLIVILIVSSVTVFFTSCSKFEDGPLISLRTKKARLSNHWKIDVIYVNEILRPDLKNKYTIEIDRKGEFVWYEGTFEIEGLWTFDQNNENVILVYYQNDIIADTKLWEIKRLANKELWINETYPDSLVEIQFVPLD